MKLVSRLFIAATVLVLGLATPSTAGDKDPLFLNLLTDESHRAVMALSFSKGQFDKGHPLTVFLNDRGVLLASKANAAKFPEQQKILAEFVAKGAQVLICAMCAEHYGMKQVDWLPGLKQATELAGDALFKDNTKTLTY